MACETITAEVVVLVDSCGDYALGKDEADAREAYENQIQALSECDGFRLIKVRVRVPLPAITELEVEALAGELAAPVAE